MIRRLLLLVLLSGALALAAFGQEVRTVDGEKYIVHTVEQGQTLFGISKHYAVPIDAIVEKNPGAAQGLSIGQILLIPKRDQSRRQLRHAPELSNGELLHTVRKKETMYGISKQFGVSQADLRRLNPDLAYGLRAGMVLRIQVARSTAAPPMAVLPAKNDSAEFHQVQPGETLYSLSKRYAVPAEAIKAANDGLPEGLKAGTYLRIPGAVEDAAIDSAATATDSLRPAPGRHRRIAVLLPFTAMASDSAKGQEANERLAAVKEAAVEFRAGLAMALDTLKKQGLNADVLVFDTGVKPAQWNALFSNDSIRGMDLYIGPFHRAAIESLVRVSGAAPIICPVPQSNKVILGNATVSKALGGRADRMKLMARYVAIHHAKDNIILLKPEVYSERDVRALMVQQLRQALATQPGRLRDTLLEVNCSRRDVKAAIDALDAAHPNILVVPSEDVEFVTTVVNKFSALVPKYKIVVYGLNAWLNMTTLDVGALIALNVHVPANGYIDRDSPEVAAFVSGYRERFHNDPGEYAFLGYDVALYFLDAEMQFGRTFAQHYSAVRSKPLHMGFRMYKLGPENGWSNGSAVMLEFRQDGVRKAE